MSKGQGIILLLLAIFYIAYFAKMLMQKRQGIKTNQMGKGKKQNKVRRLENILRLVSVIIVFIALISVLMGTQILGSNGVIIGAVLILLGDCVFIAAMWTMRDSWRAGIPAEDKTELVTRGIYRISRNPAFLGFDLMYVGIMLSFTNIILVVFTLITMSVFHMQILEEEKFLEQRFGEAYTAYKKRVGRYFMFI